MYQIGQHFDGKKMMLLILIKVTKKFVVNKST